MTKPERKLVRQFTALVTSASLEGRKEGKSPLQVSPYPTPAALALPHSSSFSWPLTPKPSVKWRKMSSCSHGDQERLGCGSGGQELPERASTAAVPTGMDPHL